MRLEPADALDRVKGALGGRVTDGRLNYGQVDATVEPGKLVEVVTILRDDIALGCRFFTFLSAVDRSTQKFDDEEQNKREAGSAGSQNKREAGSAGSQNKREAGSAGSQNKREAGSAGSQNKREAGSAGSQNKREAGSAGSQNRNGGGIEVLVHLYSPDKIFHVNLHVPLDFESPLCPSITSVFRGAEWHEREAAEMFGIHFSDHPNLATLYLSEDFEGHPMLKSFKLPARSYVKDWPGAKDPDEAAAAGGR